MTKIITILCTTLLLITSLIGCDRNEITVVDNNEKY